MLSMVVTMFTPARGYGFCGALERDGSGKETGADKEPVYFYLDVFHRLVPGGPPPLVGEGVRVVRDKTSPKPRATEVHRIESPLLRSGVVASFDTAKGWGFIEENSTGESFFLHRSEMVTSSVPIRHQKVQFYGGIRDGKKRACYVTALSG